MGKKVSIRIAPYGKYRKLIRDMQRAEKFFEGERTQKAIQQLAEAGRDFIVRGIRDTRESWDDLNDITQQLKGKDDLLVDSGSFVESMTVWQVGKRWYAGLPEGAKGSKGQDLTIVGIVHENGATVPVTDKMRNFFLARGVPLRQETKYLIIPPRPWFEPANEELNEYANEVLAPFMDELIKEIG
jgi:hypothetical protein